MNRHEDREHDEGKVVPLDSAAASNELLYEIELWDIARTGPERVIGRAASAALARAIFTAAESEHLGRKLVLRRGDRVLSETD